MAIKIKVVLKGFGKARPAFRVGRKPGRILQWKLFGKMLLFSEYDGRNLDGMLSESAELVESHASSTYNFNVSAHLLINSSLSQKRPKENEMKKEKT